LLDKNTKALVVMAVSKFGLLAVAAILIGGVSAGIAQTEAPAQPAQAATEHRTTPIASIANPDQSFRNVAVQFTSGKEFGRVVAISTNGDGRATKVRVALNDMPSQQIWLDQNDLVYSRSRDAIIAHDVHAPALAVADAR
jgi:hypothetical protein